MSSTTVLQKQVKKGFYVVLLSFVQFTIIHITYNVNLDQFLTFNRCNINGKDEDDETMRVL